MNNPLLKSFQKEAIYISDLTHTAQGISANTFPLGASYVFSYAKQQLGDSFDFKLFKFPDELSKNLDTRIPKVMCFSAYSWNLELSYKYASVVKREYPDIIIVFGGPNFPTENSEKVDFLKQRNQIDFFIELEGEFGLVDILKNLKEVDFNIKALINTQKRILNTTYLSKDILVSGPVERITDINAVPSPYLTGALDKFFGTPLIPMLETTRGCPFSCSYCADGLKSKNRIYRYDSERTKNEIGYIAKSRKEIDDLVITDLNFGMYKEDIDTAHEIAKIQEVYKYPKRISAASGKNLPKRITQVAGILKGWAPGASIQSSDPEVLKSIKRENLSTDAYKQVIVYLNSLEEGKSESEIILGIPSDTKDKHFESLRFGMDNNVTTMRMFQAIMLIGTEMASQEYRQRYGLKTKFRFLPGTAGYYKILGSKYVAPEIEEIIVASNTFDEKDYLECRVMNLLVFAFYNNSIFGEVFEMFRAMGISCFDCFKHMINQQFGFSKRVREIIELFKVETLELFDSWDEASYALQDLETMERYLAGEMGANEMLTGRARLFNEFDDVEDMMFSAAEKTLEEKGLLTKACRKYLKQLKLFISLRKKNPLDLTNKKYHGLFEFNFDSIRDAGYQVDPNKLEEITPAIKYEFYHDNDQQQYIKNQVSLWSHHAFPLGKLLQNTNLVNIFRKFHKVG